MRFAIAMCCLATTFLAGVAAAPVWAQGDAKAGAYVFLATGGCACHTDRKNKGPFLAGGRSLKTPFGVIYGSNITPDRTGIEDWSEADFVRAMTEGVNEHGNEMYPVFPYTSFTRMTEEDLGNLWAYLRTVPPVQQRNKRPELMPPFNLRVGVKAWKLLYFTPGRFRPDPARTEAWNRGAYLVTALGHCAECHTPRDLAGGLKRSLAYAGSTDGPEGQLAPNITPDKETGIGDWTEKDIVYYLQTGLQPDGDSAEKLMGELIETAYQKLREADLQAIATYLKSLPPIRNKVVEKDEKKKDAP